MNLDVASHNDEIRVRINGKSFRALVNPKPNHSSHWTFQDELSVKERWWHIQPGDVVLDIGADYGSYTLSALAMGAAHVTAWSPPYKDPLIPVEAQVLEKSLALNGWEDRAKVYTFGLWSKFGWLVCFDGPNKPEFFDDEDNARQRVADSVAKRSASPVVSLVQVQTLDQLMPSDRVDWIKIDAESAELEILRGGFATIIRHRPKILLEHHLFIDADCEQRETAFLKELGYKQDGPVPYHSIAHSLYTWDDSHKDMMAMSDRAIMSLGTMP